MNSAILTTQARKWLHFLLVLGCLAGFTKGFAAEATPEAEVPVDPQQVEFDVTIEVKGLEASLAKATDALDRVATSLEQVIKHPDLADEHQAKIAEFLTVTPSHLEIPKALWLLEDAVEPPYQTAVKTLKPLPGYMQR